MNFPLHIDASMLKEWSDCREFVRNRYLENRDTIAPSIYYEFGTAIHKGVEEFWKGHSFEKALYSAYAVCNALSTKFLNPYFTDKWKEMTDQLPDLLACYYDSQEQDVSKVAVTALHNGRPAQGFGTEVRMLEHEWSLPYCWQHGEHSPFATDNVMMCGCEMEVILCGRIDRVMVGPELPDVKTASEIASYGQSWEDAYTRSSMLAVQFGLYDWYLGQIGLAPRRCYLEVLIKGYKSKPCRYQVIELPHVTTEAYRARFRQQLAFKVSEIVHYFKHYREQKPWPMSGGSACSTKYGECPMLEGCLNGWTPKVLGKYKEREEHLLVRR